MRRNRLPSPATRLPPFHRLVSRGEYLDQLLLTCQRLGGERAAREFGLSEAEKVALYTALQLQAQQALESIRSQSERTGLDQLSDEEINAEIQAPRLISYFHT